MNAIAMGLYVNPPIVRLMDEVQAELQRMVDAETWDEAGEDRIFLAWAQRIASWRMDDTISWGEALSEFTYAHSWDDATFKNLLIDGDDAELGRMVRKAVVREFAEDIFEATEKAWELGIEP